MRCVSLGNRAGPTRRKSRNVKWPVNHHLPCTQPAETLSLLGLGINDIFLGTTRHIRWDQPPRHNNSVTLHTFAHSPSTTGSCRKQRDLLQELGKPSRDPPQRHQQKRSVRECLVDFKESYSNLGLSFRPEGGNLLFFLRIVILSVAVPSRSEGTAESKDPCTLHTVTPSNPFSLYCDDWLPPHARHPEKHARGLVSGQALRRAAQPPKPGNKVRK